MTSAHERTRQRKAKYYRKINNPNIQTEHISNKPPTKIKAPPEADRPFDELAFIRMRCTARRKAPITLAKIGPKP